MFIHKRDLFVLIYVVSLDFVSRYWCSKTFFRICNYISWNLRVATKTVKVSLFLLFHSFLFCCSMISFIDKIKKIIQESFNFRVPFKSMIKFRCHIHCHAFHRALRTIQWKIFAV